MTAPESASLRPHWLREIAGWWTHYNWLYLGSGLRAPSFALSDSERVMGRWSSERRLLEISVVHVVGDPWWQVLETLRHEMSHQFVDEVLKVRDETPHGPAFRQACERLRVDPGPCSRGAAAASPVSEARPLAAGEEASVHGRIHKLLSLAGSPNEHEAQAAMKKARQLLLKYNIELHELSQGTARYQHRRLGELKARRQSWEYLLGGVLSDFFFVHVLWVDDYDAPRNRKGRVMELYGTAFNLDMAEYVYGYLLQLLPKLWDEYRRRRRLRSQAERRSYLAGVLAGLRQQLEAQEQHLQQEQALIWVGDGKLDAYFRHHQPRTSSRQTGGVHASGAYWSGVEEGKQLRLHKPLKSGGQSSRRLGPGR